MIEFLLNYKELELLFLNACTIIFIILMFALTIVLSISLVIHCISVFKDELKNQ